MGRSAVGDLGPSRSGLGIGLEGFFFALPLALVSLLTLRVEGLMTGKSRGEARFLVEDGCEPLMVAGLDDLGSWMISSSSWNDLSTCAFQLVTLSRKLTCLDEIPEAEG